MDCVIDIVKNGLERFRRFRYIFYFVSQNSWSSISLWRFALLALSKTKSIPWLPTHWLLELPGHQQPCHWTYWITGALFPTGNGLKLQWRHNERDSASNHQPHDCLLNLLFRLRSKKTSKLRVTGLCAGNSPVTGEFPAQRASNAENVSIWWRHHEFLPSHWWEVMKIKNISYGS